MPRGWKRNGYDLASSVISAGASVNECKLRVSESAIVSRPLSAYFQRSRARCVGGVPAAVGLGFFVVWGLWPMGATVAGRAVLFFLLFFFWPVTVWQVFRRA